MSIVHDFSLHFFINQLDPEKYLYNSVNVFAEDAKLYRFSELRKEKGDFVLEFSVYHSKTDLDIKIGSGFIITFGPNSKPPQIQSDALDVIEDFGAYSWSIQENSEAATKLFTVFRSTDGVIVEVFQYEFPINTSPYIAAIIYPKVSVDEPLDAGADGSTKVKVKLRLQSQAHPMEVALNTLKSLLAAYPSYNTCMFYRLPNTTGRPEVARYALVDPTSIDDMTVPTFRISAATISFQTLRITDIDGAKAVAAQMSDFHDTMLYKSMEFYLPLERAKGLTAEDIVLRDSFRNPLTPKGEASLASLHKFVREMTNCWNLDTYYAPMTSIAQSSGLGKSKLAYELLNRLPGIYFVFRGDGDDGYPLMNQWSEKMMKSMFSDDEKADDSKAEAQVMSTRVGACLSYIDRLIQCYADGLESSISQSLSSTDAKSEEGKRLVASAIRKSAISQIERRCTWLQYVEYSIKTEMSLEDVKKSIKASVDRILLKCGLQKSDPFLLVFDELSILEPQKLDRLNGFHIIRRALHVLLHECNIAALAVGTNSNIIEFQKEATSDSVRHAKRKNFIPPFVPGFNHDVLWGYVYDNQQTAKYDLSKVKLSHDLLLNPRFEQLLISLGRPLWSSLLISKISGVATLKLKNGHMDSGESFLAMWAIRAGICIHPSHKVTKTMVKSIMATCFHSSTDGKELLIGYPSDPVLAWAARNVMNELQDEPAIYEKLLKFYNSGAVDTGQLGESIAAMLILRALDRATNRCEDKCHFTNIEGLKNLNVPRNSIFEDATIPSQENLEPPVNFSDIGIGKVWTVKTFLEVLYGKGCVKNLVDKKLISNELLEGYVNISHFVPTQKNFYWGSEAKKVASRLPQNIGNYRYVANVIDHAILHHAILHQAGLFMPSRYYGIDLIIPVCLRDSTLTYISIQVKTGTTCLDYPSFNACKLPMVPGRHYVACPFDRVGRVECQTCLRGDKDAEVICTNHLALIMCLGNDAPTLEDFKKNEHELAPNVYGNLERFPLSKKEIARDSLIQNNVTFIGSLSETALMSANLSEYDKQRIQTAIQGLLSLSRNVFDSRYGQPGFDRLVDYMQFTDMYPEANANLCRARGRPTAGIYENCEELLSIAPPPPPPHARQQFLLEEEEEEEEEEGRKGKVGRSRIFSSIQSSGSSAEHARESMKKKPKYK